MARDLRWWVEGGGGGACFFWGEVCSPKAPSAFEIIEFPIFLQPGCINLPHYFIFPFPLCLFPFLLCLHMLKFYLIRGVP